MKELIDYEELHLEFVQLISEHYDGTLDKAVNLAEQLIEQLQEQLERGLSDAE